MGELTQGMKDKLKELVDESKTDDLYTLLQAIHEGDLDVPNRMTVDFTQTQMDFLETFGAESMNGADPETVVRYFVDTARRGYYQGQATRLMTDTPPKVGKGQRKP
jgi:hypothetical protein